MKKTRSVTKSRAARWPNIALRMVVAVALVGGSAAVWHEAHAQAGSQVPNLNSARHYQTGEALYANFARQTGSKITRIGLGNDVRLERLRTESANSPADVLLRVDPACRWRAQIDGLLQPIQSNTLESRIPAQWRSEDNACFGFSSRDRTSFLDPTKVKAEDVDTYADLADPKHKGKACTRSGSHLYLLSRIGSIAERRGDAKANVRVAVGKHMNLSGGVVAKNAHNRANAIRFLEYLVGLEAKNYSANGSGEWPLATSTNVDNPELASLGNFKQDTLPRSSLGKDQIAARHIVDYAGYRRSERDAFAVAAAERERSPPRSLPLSAAAAAPST